MDKYIPISSRRNKSNLSSKQDDFRTLLDKATKAVQSKGTISSQILDPYRVIKIGIIVESSKAHADQNLPYTLFTILSSLKNGSIRKTFLQWVTDKISNNDYFDVAALLEGLSSFSLLLNSEYYEYLYVNGVLKDIPNEFKTISHALTITEECLFNIDNDLYYKLRTVHILLLSRFSGIYYKNKHLKQKPVAVEMLTLLKSHFIHEIETALQKPEDVLELLLSYFQNSVPNTLELFLSSDLQRVKQTIVIEELLIKLRKKGIERGLVHATKFEIDALNIEKLNYMKSFPRKDGENLNMADIINNKTKRIVFTVTTGTGPQTVAHLEQYLKKILNLNRELSNKSSEPSQYIMIILPNLIPGVRSDGTEKDQATSGFLYHRTGTLLIQCAEIPSIDIIITTGLQPKINETLRGRERIRVVINKLQKLITEMREKKGELANFSVETIKCYGIDEFNWECINGKLSLKSEQSDKFVPGTIVVDRYGYQTATIEHASTIANRYKVKVLLTSGSPKTSTTKGIQRFHNQKDLSGFLTTAQPFIKKYYRKSEIAKRKNFLLKSNIPETPNVDEIQRKLIEDYEKIIS